MRRKITFVKYFNKNCHGKFRNLLFLGAFAELRKAIITFVMSGRPSVRIELELPGHGFSRDLKFKDFFILSRKFKLN